MIWYVWNRYEIMTTKAAGVMDVYREKIKTMQNVSLQLGGDVLGFSGELRNMVHRAYPGIVYPFFLVSTSKWRCASISGIGA